MEDSNNAGSIMDLRITAEHYGQGVSIYREINGQFKKNSTIMPKNRTKENIKLIDIPPPDNDTVGHYEVEVNGVRRRVEAENNNCLFHAFALGCDSTLSDDEVRARAQTIRETVVQVIRDKPQRWSEHITLRTEMDNLKKGK